MMRRWRRAIAVCGLLAGVMLAGAGAIRLWRAHVDNAAIAALAAGRKMAVTGTETAAVVAARARYLIARGDLAGAQAVVDGMANEADTDTKAAALMALGNAHMRQAYGLMIKVPFWKVRPVIAVAKSEYRQALQLDPDYWDARYNYAIASSLVHDQDQAKPTTGDEMSHERAAWPDIPGAPNGMP
jgi:mxaK protein